MGVYAAVAGTGRPARQARPARGIIGDGRDGAPGLWVVPRRHPRVDQRHDTSLGLAVVLLLVFVAIALSLAIGVAVLGVFFFLTQFVQNILGFSPLQAGVAFLPMTAGIIVTSQVVAGLIGRIGDTELDSWPPAESRCSRLRLPSPSSVGATFPRRPAPRSRPPHRHARLGAADVQEPPDPVAGRG
jgi:hypothetical protein